MVWKFNCINFLNTGEESWCHKSVYYTFGSKFKLTIWAILHKTVIKCHLAKIWHNSSSRADISSLETAKCMETTLLGRSSLLWIQFGQRENLILCKKMEICHKTYTYHKHFFRLNIYVLWPRSSKYSVFKGMLTCL